MTNDDIPACTLPGNIFINPKVNINKFISAEFGYGVVANRDIEVGELLVFVPFEACIVAVDEYSLAKKISDSQEQYVRYVVSSGVLDAIPLMWNSAQKQSLVGSLRSLVESTSEDFCGIPKWAVAYMLSRSFEVEHGTSVDGDATIASVPIGDMFNHSTLNWNTRIRQCKDGFRFYAEKIIFSNSQIFNNYGINDRIIMMATHGFWDDGLSQDTLFIPIDSLSENSSTETTASSLLIPIDLASEDDKECCCLEFLENFPPSFRPRAVERMIIAIEKSLNELENVSNESNHLIRTINEAEIENLKKFRKNLFSVIF